ncbi:(2Fe-2S)-binding protein [Bordetella sp. 2513F-2]
MPLELRVNDQAHRLEVEAGTPLLYVLRNDLELNGPKYGCGLGECGACTVLLDGVPARSCVIPAGAAVGRQVTTLEGLGTLERPGVVQQAFIDAQAAQCGYCINGMIMAAHALLAADPHVTREDIRRALQYHLCRCGTHLEILDAVELAARRLREDSPE